jgi:hypothetical protein
MWHVCLVFSLPCLNCHFFCVKASIIAESSRFWHKPINCATLAVFKNECNQQREKAPVFWQIEERFCFSGSVPMHKSQVSWMQAGCSEGSLWWRGKLWWSFSGFRAIRIFLTTMLGPSVNFNVGMRKVSRVDDQILILLSAICS